MTNVSGAYWPWWLGAAALSAVTVVFWLLFKRPLGVSGSWTRVVQAPEESAQSAADRAALSNPAAFAAAMIAATQAQFGSPQTTQGGALAITQSPAGLPERLPWPAHVTFLGSLAVGGLIAAVARGGPHVQLTLGPDFQRFFGGGAVGWAVVLLGGVLVGFGTRMAGGCTSGHGLSGCSRLQGGSLAATGAFFGVGVAVSVFLWKVLG